MNLKQIKLSLILLSFCSIQTFSLKADEGMWIPMLLEQLNEDELIDMGLELTAEDIYSINKSSLKDAIVHFGGGCTAEMISKEGLLLTNHHCGYGEIQSHSSVEHDYLKDGFWAMNRSEELTNEGLTASFIKRMANVSKACLAGVNDDMSEQERAEIIKKNIEAIIKKETEGTHYEAKVKPFFKGNQYYLFIIETFTDVRLVGAPPSSIGKYGADTDNWVWPRHTGDFSIFRIYANSENKPADYSPDNVPYVPAHSLPISIGGVQEGDLTMVYGFPGRTNSYLPSDEIQQTLEVLNPAKIKIRKTV
ncbi:MAG: S46 family peptidase, partial [Flavobacteriales bacterium]